MKTMSLLAVVLFAAPALCRATDVNPTTLTPTPTPTGTTSSSPTSAPAAAPAARAPGSGSGPIPALNAAIDQMMAAFGRTEECFKAVSALRADHARKKASLTAEFKGKLPVVFDELLWRKASRINQRQEACVHQYDDLGRMFDSLATSFRTIEPKNTNIKKQTDFVTAQRTKYLAMRPTDKPYNKPAKAAAAE